MTLHPNAAIRALETEIHWLQQAQRRALDSIADCPEGAPLEALRDQVRTVNALERDLDQVQEAVKILRQLERQRARYVQRRAPVAA
jgi:prefoldin subunit 5